MGSESAPIAIGATATAINTGTWTTTPPETPVMARRRRIAELVAHNQRAFTAEVIQQLAEEGYAVPLTTGTWPEGKARRSPSEPTERENAVVWALGALTGAVQALTEEIRLGRKATARCTCAAEHVLHKTGCPAREVR